MTTSIHFKQYDSRWANKRYPTWGTGNMKYCGCGPTTASIIISSVDKSITPYKVAKEISEIQLGKHKGATKGGATYIEALCIVLKRRGFVVSRHATMEPFFNAINAADRDVYGILDVWGHKNGITWCGGGIDNGHYVPVTAIRNRTTMYIKDPGLRKNTGWHKFETDLKGHVKNDAITCYHPSTVKKKVEAKTEVKAEEKTEAKTEVKKTPNQEAIEAAVAYAKSLAANNTYGYKHYDKTDHMCPICHPKTKVKGFNCIGLVAACFAHGAGDKTLLANCNKNNGSALGNDVTLTNVSLDSWRKKNGSNWTMISSGSAKNSKSLDVSKLKAGDVLIGYDTKGKYKHTMIYIGGGKIVDAKSSGTKADQIGIRNYSSRATNMRISRAFRYTGNGGF